MDTNVRFHPTLGLVAVVVLHAIMLAAVFAGLHRSPTVPDQPQIVLPTYPAPHNFGANVGQYPTQQAPAHPKLDEMKQGSTDGGASSHIPAPLLYSGGVEPTARGRAADATALDGIKTQCSTGNCPTPTSMSAAGQSTANALAAQLGARIHIQRTPNGDAVFAFLPAGRVWAVTGQQGTQAYAGPNRWIALTTDMQRGLATSNATPNAPNPLAPPNLQPPLPEAQVPTIPAPNGAAAPTQHGRKYQLALFLDGSPRSAELQRWFAADPNLATLVRNCETQIYTAANALYRARYADIVPASQFPAVLFLAPDGGHIHATGGSMLPSTAADLLADLQASYALAQSVQSAESIAQASSGALRERGYNWDTAVQRQQPQRQPFQIISDNPNCPDGSCDDSTWLPRRPGGGDGLLPLLGPAVDHSRNALFWLGNTDIIVFGLIIIVGGLITFIVWRRM